MNTSKGAEEFPAYDTKEMTESGPSHERLTVKPVLVYWHCGGWWDLTEGSVCPNRHDASIYGDGSRKGRKRRVWMCTAGGKEGAAYLYRRDFLAHREGECEE